MFLPISDAPNPKGVPFATWTLIALNVALFLFLNVPLGMQRADVNDPAFHEYLEFLAQYVGSRAELVEAARRVSAYDLFVFAHGYRPAQPEITDLFFSMFLHGSLAHIFGNMLFLWIYGDNVERRLGWFGYVLWYLSTGAAATLFHAAVFSTSQVPLVGASGAISGVLGFYFVWFPRNVVRVLAFLPPFLMQVFEVPARFVLGIYLLLDNLLPFLFAGEGGVAHGAHIGGFVAGAAAAWLMERRVVDARPRVAGATRTKRFDVDAMRATLAGGDLAEAAADYCALPATASRGALTPPEAVRLAAWLRQQGQVDAALVLLRRLIRDTLGGPGLAEAHALIGSILLEDLGEPTAAYQYLLTALELEPRPETAARIRGELATIEASQKRRVGRLRQPR